MNTSFYGLEVTDTLLAHMGIENNRLTNPTSFARWLMNIDRHYQYSDDASVYRQGERMEQIRKTAITNIHDALMVSKMVNEYLNFIHEERDKGTTSVELEFIVAEKYDRKTLAVLKPETEALIKSLTGGIYDPVLARAEFLNYVKHVDHVDQLTKTLGSKLINWKPKTHVLNWDQVHVPVSYHAEMKHLINYLLTAIIDEKLGAQTQSFILQQFKYLEISIDHKEHIVYLCIKTPNGQHRYRISQRI